MAKEVSVNAAAGAPDISDYHPSAQISGESAEKIAKDIEARFESLPVDNFELMSPAELRNAFVVHRNQVKGIEDALLLSSSNLEQQLMEMEGEKEKEFESLNKALEAAKERLKERDEKVENLKSLFTEEQRPKLAIKAFMKCLMQKHPEIGSAHIAELEQFLTFQMEEHMNEVAPSTELVEPPNEVAPSTGT